MIHAGLLRELLRRRATFTAYRTPGSDPVVHVQRSPALGSPVSGEEAFVIAPFNTRAQAVHCIRPDLVITGDHGPQDLEGFDGADGSDVALGPGLDREGYRAAVVRAVEELRSGSLDKVVLARTIEADLQGVDIAGLFLAAVAQHPEAFVALVHTPTYGTWLCATPERLLLVRDDLVEVDAIAGTQLYAAAPANAEAWGAKERREQELVTNHVRETLAHAQVGSLHTEGPIVKRAGNLAHLHSRITGRAAHRDVLGLAAALHPTPAVGGAPRARALQLIQELEPIHRSLYAGYWGPMGRNGTNFFVNIRCMQVDGDRALLHVGAGITSDSDPERECDEVEQKARLWLDLIEAQRRAG